MIEPRPSWSSAGARRALSYRSTGCATCDIGNPRPEASITPHPMVRKPGSMPIMRIVACAMAEPNVSRRAGEYAKRTHSKSIRFKARSLPTKFRRGYEPLNLSHGVEDGRVVTAAETASDFWKRARGQEFGKIHGDLARPHDGRGSPRGKNIGAADIEMACDQFLDVFDLIFFGSGVRTRSRIARSEVSIDSGAPFKEAWASSRLTAPSRSRPFV